MLSLIIAFTSFLLVIIIAGYLVFSVMRSKEALEVEPDLHFFLPNDFFVSLTLLTNFWLVLLVLLGSQELLQADKQIIVVFTSLFAPFLSWWHQKKDGGE